jgi:hypothetical protein
MSPDEESTRPGITVSLKRYYDDGAPPVVSVVSPVVVGVGRRDREYCKQSGKHQDHDLFHFCSSSISMIDLSRDLQLGNSTQPFNALPATWVCSKLLTLAEALDCPYEASHRVEVVSHIGKLIAVLW